MKLCELLCDVKVTKWGCAPETEVSGVVSDSRHVMGGELFVAIVGTTSDGHDHVCEAFSRGCAAAVVSRADTVSGELPYILVENTRHAEAHIWNNLYGRPADGMKVIAVTGTGGKSSTSMMIREIFLNAGHRVGIVSTIKIMADDETIFCNGGSSLYGAAAAMTTPDPEILYSAIATMKERGVDTLVLELSSHALDQYKADPISIDVAVFTNLTPEHLDYHGDMERYFQAKARLATMAKRLVVNIDDKYMSRLASVYRDRSVTCSADSSFGGSGNADVTALRQNSLGMSGMEYVYFSREAVFKVKSPIPGRFTVYNSMLAGAAAMAAGASPEAVRDGIRSLDSVNGRLERVSLDADVPFEVFIDYAHTPAALEGLLNTVRGVRNKGQRIILLFGCGGERDRSKRSRMGAIASRLADFVIITEDNSRREPRSRIITDIMAGIDREKPHVLIYDRREAIEYAVRCAGEGDIILLVGKGHEQYEINEKGKVPFSEAEIVRNAVKGLEDYQR